MAKEELMALFKSGNPALGEKTFTGLAPVADADDVMTLQGTVNKIAVLLTLVFAAATFTWWQFNLTRSFAAVALYFYGGLLGGFAVAMILIFKKQWAPYLAVVYAGLEGLALGGLSAVMDASYPGIAFEALLLTFGILAVLLVVYSLRIIRATENFKLIVVSATGGIALFYIVSLVLSFFGVRAPLIHDNSLLGIGFTLVVVVIAALNLVVDFDFIEQGVENRSPRYMEWYAAFGILVTLVWLYIELLRLLSKLRSRN
jgi:uncharacterized YccA/Bax inhibitor family protein